MGLLPDALATRERLEAIHRRPAGSCRAFAYDLPNRAELLIRLGRADEAEVPLRRG